MKDKKSYDHLNTCKKKTFDKIQDLFMIKTLNKVGLEVTCLNIQRPYMKNPQLTLYSMVKT